MWRRLIFLLFIIISLIVRWAHSDDCNLHTDCVSCTKTNTWWGADCHWCSKDNQCHTQGSLFNPCTAQEDKLDPSQCDQVISEYDPVAASTDYIFMSALSYSPNPIATMREGNMTAPRKEYFNLEFNETRSQMGRDQAMIGGVALVMEWRKEIVIAFRGTVTNEQLFWEGFYTLVYPTESLVLAKGTGKVQAYFLSSFKVLLNWINDYLSRNWKPTYRLVFVGHSLGGAMASIAALYYSPANAGLLDPSWTAHSPKLYTFGMPRVGDSNYAQIHDQFVRESWRITHKWDIVPHLPWCDGIIVGGVRFCTNFPTKAPYHHGYEVWYPNDMDNPTDFKQCFGIPFNEDKLCSNVYPWPIFLGGVPEHLCYFGRMIGQWWYFGDKASVC